MRTGTESAARGRAGLRAGGRGTHTSGETDRAAERERWGGERQEQRKRKERDRKMTQKDSERKREREKQGETDRNPPRKDTPTESFPKACYQPERWWYGQAQGGVMARQARPLVPSEDALRLATGMSLCQLHAAPHPPLPSVPLPRPLICKILGFAGTLNPYGADSFPSKSSP